MLDDLYEYLYLEEPGLSEYSQIPRDYYFKDFIMIRKVDSSVYIYFLWTIDHIKIPIEYLKLIEGFEVSYGGKYPPDYIPQDPEKFLYLLLQLHREVLDIKDIKETLDSILSIGSKNFRGWLKEKLGISLEPWIYIDFTGEHEL